MTGARSRGIARAADRLGGMLAAGASLLSVVSVMLMACQGSVSRPPSTGAGGSAGPRGTGGSPTLTVACETPALGTPALRLLTGSELISTLNDIFPTVAGQWTSMLPAGTVSAFGFDNDASTTVGKQLAGGLLDTAQSLATALTGGALASLLPCSQSAANRGCAEQFLTQYGRRLFRRPLTAAEHDRYLGFFDTSLAKSNFTSALKWMIIGLIQSPSAVYRSEIGAAQSDGTRRLSPHEVATALGYIFGGSTPSTALLDKADSGDLGDVLAIARSLQATPEGHQVLQRFFQSYLSYTSVSSIQKPNIANFNSVSADMVRETDAFINDVVVLKGGGMKDLLTATTTNPSAALASYYGFPAPAGDYASMPRPAGRGLGILAQGSFLATHASSDSSSPTKRGLFPYFRLFCQPKLVPPDNVPKIGQPMPGHLTTRQRYEQAHVSNDGCAYCHKRFDPIGFAFEHFDEGGRFRADEAGLPIDSMGSVPDPNVAGASLFSFTGEESLVTGLATQAIVHQCVAAYMATYAFGSGEACIGASQVQALQAGGMGLAEAFVRLAAEPHFTRRSAQ